MIDKSKLNSLNLIISKSNTWQAIGQKNQNNCFLIKAQNQSSTLTRQYSSYHSLQKTDRIQRYNSKQKQKTNTQQFKSIKSTIFKSYQKLNKCKQLKDSTQQPKQKNRYQNRKMALRMKIQYQIDRAFKSEGIDGQSKLQNKQIIQIPNQYLQYLILKVKRLKKQNNKIKQEFNSFKKKMTTTIKDQKQIIQNIIYKLVEGYHIKIKQYQSKLLILQNDKSEINQKSILNNNNINKQIKKIQQQNKTFANLKNKITDGEHRNNYIINKISLNKEANVFNLQKKQNKTENSRQKSFEKLFAVIRVMKQNVDKSTPIITQKENRSNNIESQQINQTKINEKSSILKIQDKSNNKISIVSLQKNSSNYLNNIQIQNILIHNSIKENSNHNSKR